MVLDPSMKIELKKFFNINETHQNTYKEDVSRIQMGHDRRYCYWWRGASKLAVISCDNIDILH